MYRHCCASLTYENIKFEQLQINKKHLYSQVFFIYQFSTIYSWPAQK